MASETDVVRRWHNTRAAFRALHRERVEDRAVLRASHGPSPTLLKGDIVRRFLKSDPDADRRDPRKWVARRPERWRVLSEPIQGRVFCEPLGRQDKNTRPEPKWLDTAALTVVPAEPRDQHAVKRSEPAVSPRKRVKAWDKPRPAFPDPPRRSPRLARLVR